VLPNPPRQYATDCNLAARQRLWSTSRREPSFDLFAWVIDVAGIDSMLYHVPDVRAAAREIRRVLRPDGLFVAVTNGVCSPPRSRR
jgi:SAM-dependent methyltransferase